MVKLGFTPRFLPIIEPSITVEPRIPVDPVLGIDDTVLRRMPHGTATQNVSGGGHVEQDLCHRASREGVVLLGDGSRRIVGRRNVRGTLDPSAFEVRVSENGHHHARRIFTLHVTGMVW